MLSKDWPTHSVCFCLQLPECGLGVQASVSTEQLPLFNVSEALLTYVATGLASPEEPLLDGNEGSNRESAWGNGQKQVCISAIGPARR